MVATGVHRHTKEDIGSDQLDQGKDRVHVDEIQASKPCFSNTLDLPYSHIVALF